MPPLQGLKKEIPILSSYHPTLPSPFPEGGIYDKGEGLGGGEKWDFLYNKFILYKELCQQGLS